MMSNMMFHHGLLLDSEEAKNVAVVHKTNQGYSGKDLWRLKQERPELFGLGAAGAATQTAATGSGAASSKPPQGYQRVADMPAWFYNPQASVYLNNESGKHFCRDSATGAFYELHTGEDISASLSVRGDAAACARSQGGASRHVVINDLHRAAASMKLDLAHLDSPAAMFAVYDGRACAGGPAQAEAAAKGLHVRLLPRLASYRGHWEDDRIQAAVLESIDALATEIGSADKGVSVAVALLLGRRLTLAASRTCVCMFLDPEDMDAGLENDVVAKDGRPSAHSIDLAHHETHLGALLTVDTINGGEGALTNARLHAIMRPHIASDRLKAACVAVLVGAQKNGTEPPLVAAAVRFAWTQNDGDEPVPKRARTDGGPAKVRCRHILLRHASSVTSTGDRRKKATRTQAEAEQQMLGIFVQVNSGDPTAFTTQCRAISECDTALRGGDLAGDIGWLDRNTAKNKKVPAQVVLAAFTLAIGQVSDIVSSERGVHLVLRTA
eukprot:TRINITY_DN61337_c0_g1_i1.p1 TRINITY_DN61337_c0_g1~~TRINITY_DN61337_c0_g1_i1.p1  ORF type:complete len:496 (-),score=76.55 TRINITY_DN61337_c0_g1_i1:292-1779(-)